MSSEPEKLLPFERLVDAVGIYQNCLGLERYMAKKEASTWRWKAWLLLNFYVCIGNHWASVVEEFGGALELIPGLNLFNFYTLIEGLSCAFCNQMGTVKHTSVWISRGSMERVILELRALYHMRPFDRNEVAIVNEYVERARLVLVVYMRQTVITGSLYGLSATIWGFYQYAVGESDELYVLPLAFWYPYDTHANLLVFVVTWFFQVHASWCTAFGMNVYDGTLCIVLTHFTVHYEILAYNLRKIGVHGEETSPEERERIDTERIKLIVTVHTSLLKLGHTVNSTFGFALLNNVTFLSAMICCLLFGMTIAPPALAAKYFLLMLLVSIQLVLVSYYGEKLKNSSHNLVEAVMDSNWPDTSLKTKKSLLQILNQAVRYQAMSALGFAELSLLTLMSVMKVCGSYFALVKTMYANMLEKYEAEHGTQ